MSGQWPPEWEDSEEEYPGENDQLDTEAEARLSEVAAFLGALPAPAMPDAVEARISAALAAEARASAGEPEPTGPTGPAGPAAAADGARTLDTSRPRPRAGRHRGGRQGRDGTGPRRRFRVRPSTAAGSLVAILLVAGLGFGLSRATPSSSSSGAASGGVAIPAAGEVPSPASSSAAAAGSGAAGSSAGGFGTAGAGPKAGQTEAVPEPEQTVSPFFAVTVSGTSYEEPTLAAQVRGKLAPSGGKNTVAGTFPAPTTNPRTSVTPSAALRGCVLHFTNGAAPRLVDRATYDGQPAYVIASSTQVWVVGLGCTAAKPELITQVPLAG